MCLATSVEKRSYGTGACLNFSGQFSMTIGYGEGGGGSRGVKARAAFLQLKNIWISEDLTLQTKIRMFNGKPVPLGESSSR